MSEKERRSSPPSVCTTDAADVMLPADDCAVEAVLVNKAKRGLSSASTSSVGCEEEAVRKPPTKLLRSDVCSDGIGDSGEEDHGDDDGGEFEFQGRRKLNLRRRNRAVIFSGDLKDFTAASLAAARSMKGPVRETRLTQQGDLVVEVDNDEDLATLSAVRSLAGVPVAARVASSRVISKGSVFGVHRSITEVAIVESLRKVGVTEAVRVKARDQRLGAMVKTDKVILTFADGAQIPEQVCIGLTEHAVVAYHEPLQCFRCNRFGHVSKNCDQQADVCRRCAEPGHLSNGCTKAERCINCSGPHSAKYGACPVRQRILANWRRSLASPTASAIAPVPIVRPVSGVNAHQDFRSGRSYAGAVKNGVRVPAKQSPLSTHAPSVATLDAAARPERGLRTPHLDVEAITASISESVYQRVSSQLESMITKVVSEVLTRVIPQITEAIVSSLQLPVSVRPQEPTHSAESLDVGALVRASLPAPHARSKTIRAAPRKTSPSPKPAADPEKSHT